MSGLILESVEDVKCLTAVTAGPSCEFTDQPPQLPVVSLVPAAVLTQD